jgi:hypothetical protein
VDLIHAGIGKGIPTAIEIVTMGETEVETESISHTDQEEVEVEEEGEGEDIGMIGIDGGAIQGV